MTNLLPLITHTDPDAPLAYGRTGVINAGRFLADVRSVARQLPPGRHVLNVCSDRYHFAVGLAAAIVSGKVSLLPSTHTPETVRQLQAMAPDVFCLSDQENETIDLPVTRFPTLPSTAVDLPFSPPLIDAGQLVAQVFTSGSTGLPVPHRKHWGSLFGNVTAAAASLGVTEQAHRLVATVPPQHMYGLESSVLLAMLSGGAFWAGRPFYPADITAAMMAVPAPRVLVTTPVHLRALCDAHAEQLALPATALVLCATAPLATALARQSEHDFAAPLREIYGCTETGQLATRRPVESAVWQLFPDIQLEQAGDTTFAAGSWIEGRIALGDLVEPLPPTTPFASGNTGRFILHGRHADLINIAGKRTSLAYLNHQLTSIAGVKDGAFFAPDEIDQFSVSRLVACVVAPGCDRRSIEQALRQRIDPIFLPRPLHLVPSLPRNATGKLPRPAFKEFIAALSLAPGKPTVNPATGCNAADQAPVAAAASGIVTHFLQDLPLAADHPALAGHFPGRPIVPGVVLLDHTIIALGRWLGHPLGQTAGEILSAKFLSPVSPGESLTLDATRKQSATDDSVQFDIRAGERRIATGKLKLSRS